MQIQAEEEREESQCDTVRSDSENRIILPQIPGDGGAVHRGGGEGQQLRLQPPCDKVSQSEHEWTNTRKRNRKAEKFFN